MEQEKTNLNKTATQLGRGLWYSRGMVIANIMKTQEN
jgi:hypothetical protein